MKKLLLGAALAASMLAAASGASAATVITLPPAAADGSISAEFGASSIGAGAFTHEYEFTFPGAGSASATISSIMGKLESTNIDFSKVALNGIDFDIGSMGQNEFRTINDLGVLSGVQKLLVEGTSGGNGSYSVDLAFSPTAAVPEPATWALMIIGFGSAGAMVRNRRKLLPVA